MEDLISQFKGHFENSLTYWACIRLLRLTIRVSELEKKISRVIAHLSQPYVDQ